MALQRPFTYRFGSHKDKLYTQQIYATFYVKMSCLWFSIRRVQVAVIYSFIYLFGAVLWSSEIMLWTKLLAADCSPWSDEKKALISPAMLNVNRQPLWTIWTVFATSCESKVLRKINFDEPIFVETTVFRKIYDMALTDEHQWPWHIMMVQFVHFP